jgi:peptidoglycan/LPS O-acetylase OafA/YrhL
MQHIKSLDGIRGVAVLLVVLFHGGLIPFGWVGVQLFFALSGYLITKILTQEADRPIVEYFGHFFWRRALRIFPLYFFFLALAATSYVFTTKPTSFGADWPYLLTYTTNFGRLRSTDVGLEFIHLWSLAVEEQFYLFWPLLVYFLPLAMFKRVTMGIIVLTPLVRLLLYFCLLGHDPDWVGRAIYCLPISQMDAFASGAAISLWRLEVLKISKRLLFLAFIVAGFSGGAILAYEHSAYRAAVKWSFGYLMYLLPAYGFVWQYSLLNFLSALIIICAVQPGRLNKILAWNPVVRIGEISYGIYVYHLPLLLAIEGLRLPWTGTFALYCSTTLIASIASFRLLEAPFLRLKPLLFKSAMPVLMPLGVQQRASKE